MKKTIRLFEPSSGLEEENAIKKTLRSGFWASGAGSNNVERFEREFKKFVNSKICVSVNSGTAALHLSLSLFDIKENEVILPSLSFVTTAHSIIYNNGKPIFVDVDPDTLCINADSISDFINEKTRMIIPVHFGGMICDLDKIKNSSQGNEIVIIEDAAHACGARYKGRKIGSHSDAVCFSFHPVKNLAMPTGGAITLNGKKINQFEKLLRSKRWCGITNRKGAEYDVAYLGWNYYMNEFSAAIGLEQLKKIEMMNQRRKHIAKRYFEEISVTKKMPFDKNCVYHLYWIMVKDRKKFMKNMTENGVETGIHYKPIHKFRFYNKKLKLPVTEYASQHIVSLPMHTNLSDDEVSKIIKLTNKFSSYS